MIKITALTVAFIAFLIFLGFYVVPQQGGLNSSTELSVNELSGVSPTYEEKLPIQEVDLGSQGRSIFIAFVMLSHVLLANLHLGGSWIAVITASIYLRTRKERLNRLARSITLFNVILFSAGATFAAAGVVFFISLFPVFAENAFHIYWWPLFVEAILFAVEIFFLYTFWFSWGKIRDSFHQLLGYGYALSVFLQTLMINTIAAGMLTPGGGSINWGDTGILTMSLNDLLSWWNNATVWFLQFHRLAASVSYFGFILVALAMFHFLDRKDSASKMYWDWVGSYGMAWGLLGLVFQPGIGLMYMLAIQQNEPAAFTMIMHGPRAWEMLLMVGLLSALVISNIIYFLDRREKILSEHESRTIYAIMRIFLGLAVIAALILISPSWIGSTIRGGPGSVIIPFGLMIYKYMALIIMVVIGSVVLTVDVFILGDLKESDWGNIPKSARYAGIFSSVMGMWLVITMGFVRESARSPWLIYNIIPVPGQMNYPTPIAFGSIIALWLIIMAITLTVFWFVSKVTAEHPESAEEV